MSVLTHSFHTPELLAPAGSMVTARAALDAGADAIYAGLAKFNARERGENFDPDSFAALIDYAHRLNRKVYAAVNTIVKEQELPELISMLGTLADIGPDALIVQDLGVLRIIRQYFPELVIHASTQMGLHNSPGIRFAKASGVKRIILERQITLPELEQLAVTAEKEAIELEVFVHGALCCSLSGQCLFSSYLGGASGNRGQCKQPCRRRFFSKTGNGFFFSTKDLCSINHLDTFRRLKITSLKIEGRLRQADYVFSTVGAYRKLLDGERIDRKAIGEARNLLSDSCGRKWSDGFLSEQAMQTVIQSDSLGAAGMLCGKVERIMPNGFGFKASRKVRVGDRLRIQPTSGDEGPALTVTRLFANDRPEKKALPGEFCFVCCDKEVPFGGWIFKTGVTLAPPKQDLPQARARLKLAIKLGEGKISAQVVNADQPFYWEESISTAPATSRPISTETLQKEFAMGNSDTFTAIDISAEIDGTFFVPASELKKVRRSFWEKVHNELNASMLHSAGSAGMMAFYQHYKAFKRSFALPDHAPETVAMRPRGDEPGNPKARRATSILDLNAKTDEVILPEFCPEERISGLEKAITRAIQQGIRRFRVTSVFALELLKKYTNLEIIPSFPLPVANSMAVEELKEWGAVAVQGDIELEKSALEALRDHSALPLEIYRYGRPALLVTRAEIPVSGTVKDARSNEFLVKKDKRSGLTYIYPATVFSIPRLSGTLDYYDLQQAYWGEKETSVFNYENGLR